MRQIRILWASVGFAIAAEGMDLDLREAIRLALQPGVQNRLVSAQIEAELAEARLALQRSAMALQVDAGVTESMLRFDLRSLGLDLPEASPFVVNVSLRPVAGPFTLLDMRMFATKPIVNRSVANQVRAARDAVEVSKSSGLKAQAQVAAETAKAYFGALMAQSSLGLAQGTLEQSRYLLRVEEDRKAQGLVTGGDVRRAQLQVRASEQKLVSARAMARVTMLQLQAMTGIAYDTPVQLLPVENSSKGVPTMDGAMEQAMQFRADLKEYRAQTSGLRHSANAIRSQRLPTLMAFGNFGGLSTAPTPNRTSPASISYTFAAGMRLQMPVFDGGRRALQLAEVDLQRRALENANQGLARKVELEIQVSLEKLRAAREQLESIEGSMGLVHEDLEQVRELLKAGEATAVELREAESRRAQAQYQRVVAQHEVNLARLALAEATGTVLEFTW